MISSQSSNYQRFSQKSPAGRCWQVPEQRSHLCCIGKLQTGFCFMISGFFFSFKGTVWSKEVREWKLLNKVAFAEFMLLFRQNYECRIGLMMMAVFTQTPTVSLLFEALALSYRSLMSITWHVANFAHLSCFYFYLFPWNENRLWHRRGRQERSRTMSHRESEKSHRPVELKQDQTRSLVDPTWSSTPSVTPGRDQLDSIFIDMGEGMNKARKYNIGMIEREQRAETRNVSTLQVLGAKTTSVDTSWTLASNWSFTQYLINKDQ